MRTEIKDVIDNLTQTVLDSTASMIKGESEDTVECIKQRNSDVALLKLGIVISDTKKRILTKAKAKGINVTTLSHILNEEF